MAEWKRKRFWKEATIVEVDAGYTVHLDGRPVKTPAKAPLVMPTFGFAQGVADEWKLQSETVDPNTMPLTRLANAAIDKVSIQFDEVASMLSEYGGSDLLCYRAQEPLELVQRQADAWDPLLKWAEDELSAPLIPVHGVMFQSQPTDSLKQLQSLVMKHSAFELSAFHDLVCMSGSLILAFAVTRAHLNAAAAWNLSRLDEEWQIEQWGDDEDAAKLAAIKQEQFECAAAMFDLLKGEES